MWFLYIILVIGIGFALYRWLSSFYWEPLRRVSEFSRNIAQGRSNLGYVPDGPKPLRDLINNLQKIDERLAQVSSSAKAEEFSLKAILASMVEGVVVTDASGVIQVANRAFMQMFGIRQDPARKPLLDVLMQVEVKLMIDKAVARRTEVTGDIVIEDMRGKQERKVFRVSVSPLDSHGARVTGVVSVFHDISRMVQLEDIRREFVANVSHELRTPLAIFQGYLETLLSAHDLPEEDLQRVLGVMKRHSDRLNNIVADLLTLSRLESGRIELEPVAIRVPDFLKKLEEDWSKFFAEKKCFLRIVCPESVGVLHADTLRLEQVFYNLLDNALKYSDEGKTVEAGVLWNEQKQLFDFYVKDQGVGIPTDKLGNIFQRFYRVDRARSRDKGGTGLGLAIVKHIVQQHGGEVWAESVLGEGTTVWFRLPRDPQPADSDQQALRGP